MRDNYYIKKFFKLICAILYCTLPIILLKITPEPRQLNNLTKEYNIIPIYTANSEQTYNVRAKDYIENTAEALFICNNIDCYEIHDSDDRIDYFVRMPLRGGHRNTFTKTTINSLSFEIQSLWLRYNFEKDVYIILESKDLNQTCLISENGKIIYCI